MALLLEPSHQHRQGYTRYLEQPDTIDHSDPGDVSEMRIVLVDWRIIKGQESLFLDYWSRRETIEDRSGLIGEFLSRVQDRAQFPWITCELSPEWTCFVNVGLWRDAEAFQDQIGWRLDDARPKMPFEYERRRRTFLGPQRWRFGGTAIPTADHQLVA